MGRYTYQSTTGYEKEFEICRLPKEVMKALNTYEQKEKVIKSDAKERDMDYIDFSDIQFEDNPEDFFPRRIVNKKNLSNSLES